MGYVLQRSRRWLGAYLAYIYVYVAIACVYKALYIPERSLDMYLPIPIGTCLYLPVVSYTYQGLLYMYACRCLHYAYWLSHYTLNSCNSGTCIANASISAEQGMGGDLAPSLGRRKRNFVNQIFE